MVYVLINHLTVTYDMPGSSRVVQVTNVAPATTRDQLKTLFGFLGRIDDLVIYPSSDSSNATSKVCFVKFAYAEDVAVALHLTNTVFIDRALNIATVSEGRIPDEKTALSASYAQSFVSSESTKGDEVERTVYVANLDTSVSPEVLMQFFGLHAGEVKYARMAGDEGIPVRAAFIEFSEKASVSRALALTGEMLGGRPVTVVPSNTAIVKSVSGLEGASSHEIEEALRKVNEAQPLISAAVDGSRRKRSRSKSRSRSRSRRSRSHRSQSRSRKHSRSRSPRSRRRSRSRSPKSSSKSKDHRRQKNRSKSPRPDHSQRSQSRGKDKKNKGGSSPSQSERDDYGSSKRSSKSDRSHEAHRKSRSSRSKSPVPYTSRKDKDRHRDSVDYDSRREQGGCKRDKKSGDGRDHGNRKASLKHHRQYDEKEERSKRAAKQRDESDEDRNEKEERSAAEESHDDESHAKGARSESDQSDVDQKQPSDEESSGAAHANLSRMDMDVDSD